LMNLISSSIARNPFWLGGRLTSTDPPQGRQEASA
jgi:hypothetical protein